MLQRYAQGLEEFDAELQKLEFNMVVTDPVTGNRFVTVGTYSPAKLTRLLHRWMQDGCPSIEQFAEELSCNIPATPSEQEIVAST